MELFRKLFYYSILNNSIPKRIAFCSHLYESTACTGPILNEEKPLKRPKKPAPPFFFFLEDNKHKWKQENPNMKASNIMKLAGELWSTVDHDVKLKYMNIYHKRHAEFMKELSKYEASLKEKKLSTLSKGGNQQNLRAMIKELGKPKIPLTAYKIYLASRRKLENENKSQWFRRISDEWQNLPESEKQKYFDKEYELLKTYQKNTQKWIIEVLSHKNERYKPLQAVLFRNLQSSLRRISTTSRDEIINYDLKDKRRKEEYKEKSDVILRFINEFD